MGALPPPLPGTAYSTTRASKPDTPTLPIIAAYGAIAVLTASLIVSKYLLDAVVGFRWPVVVYVALLAVVAYGPSLVWCRVASRRWGTGDLGVDIGLQPRLADLGWGPVVWLCAIGAQLAVAAVVVGLGIPVASNTDTLNEVRDDRTYVIALVITAVVAAPIVEEMVFRGVVMRGLRSRLSIIPVIVVQGLLFGAAHFDPVRGTGNLGLVMVLAGVGIAFGAATAIIGRLGPAIVAHALFNGAILLVVLTGVADRLQEPASGSAAVSRSEEVAIVDQADLADAHGQRDPGRSGAPSIIVECLERLQRGRVEDLDVVERSQRL